MDRRVGTCSNPNCKWPIYKGDEVWGRGRELFCHIQCLYEVMKSENEGK